MVGCSPQVTFAAPGERTITLTGIDGHGASKSTSVVVNVVQPLTGPPSISITQPYDGALLPRDTYSTLEATVDDPDNGGPITYEWVLHSPNAAQPIVLGTGQVQDGGQANVSWLPATHVSSGCGPLSVTLELKATDAQNESDTASVAVSVNRPPC